MTYDLLAFAEECEKVICTHCGYLGKGMVRANSKDVCCEVCGYAVRHGASPVAAALRAAHEELRTMAKAKYTAREAYTNIGTERDSLQLECERLRELVRRHESEIARLRNAIEDAPHGGGCSSRAMILDETENFPKSLGLPCDCWKSKALREQDLSATSTTIESAMKEEK